MHLTPLKRAQARIRAALRRSSADHQAAPRLPAPVRPGQRVDTRNEAAWVAIAVFLADRVVNP
jgi:hypothetical protein